jgi:hypothetical protein
LFVGFSYFYFTSIQYLSISLFIFSRLPDSPAEPDLEVPLERTDTAPVVIPLDDVTGNPESVYDHRHLPWPEPKLPPYGLPHPVQPHMLHPPHQHHGQPPHMQQPYQPPLQQQQQFAPMFRNAGPMEPSFDHHGPPREMPLHQEQSMLHQLHHRHPQGRGGQWNDGPIDDGPRGDQGGTWMVSTLVNFILCYLLFSYSFVWLF